MTANTDKIFSDEEKDILQEIMNIAFGNATAELVEVFDIYVNLNAPNIQMINMGDLPDYVKNIMGVTDLTSIVDQKFLGDLNGSGVLVIPHKSGQRLATILENQSPEALPEKSAEERDREILLEIGNILIGACVGKISELLSTYVTYSPPEAVVGDLSKHNLLQDALNPEQIAIVMKTIFNFKEKNVNGFLLILTNQKSIKWLQNALHIFMESYE